MTKQEWKPRLWVHLAACRDLTDWEKDDFFPLGQEHTRKYRETAVRAKAVCRTCPVRSDCLEWALDEPDGIAGGMTPDERRALRAELGMGKMPESEVDPALPEGNNRVVAERGRAAIRQGVSISVAAQRFGVTRRAAERWAHDVRAEQQSQLEAAR